MAPGEGVGSGAGDTATHGLAADVAVALARTRIEDDPGGSENCAWPLRTFSVALRFLLLESR